MHRNKKILSIFILLLVSIPLLAQNKSSVTLSGATDDTDNLNLIIEFLAGSAPDADIQITVAEMPDDMPVAFTVPDNMTLVGTINRGQPFGLGLEVWILSALDPQETVDTIAADFLANDWFAPEDIYVGNGGFTPHQNIGMGLCAADGEQFVWVNAQERTAGTYTTLQLQEAHVPPFCFGDTSVRQPEGVPQAFNMLPTLTTPDGVTVNPYAGGGGGGGLGRSSASSSIELVSELPLSAIADEYITQVNEQGWELNANGSTSQNAFATWTIIDEDGVLWRALLNITAYPDNPNAFFANIQVENVPDNN